MLLSSLIEELCTKEENNKASCTLTFGGQCILRQEKKTSSKKGVKENQIF